MNMKQRGDGVEKKKNVDGANGAQTCTGQQTLPSPIAPYNVVNANFRKFGRIFRLGAHVALMEGAHEH